MKVIQIVLIFALILVSVQTNEIWSQTYCQHTECADSFVGTLECAPDQENNRVIGEEFFYENLNGVTLQASARFPGTVGDNAYSHDLPSGWTVDNEGTTPGALEEYNQWTVANKEWWFTAGDSLTNTQQRDQFQIPCQNILVADNDNHNDNVTGFVLQTSFTTDSIDISQSSENDLFLIYDQSWRPWADAQGEIWVSYDNGEFQQVQIVSSNSSSPNYVPDQLYQTVIVPLYNQDGASQAKVRFDYYDGNNGWFWAVSRIGVFSYPCQDGYETDLENGDLCIVKAVVVEEVVEEEEEQQEQEEPDADDDDDDDECVAVYSECDYQGEEQTICEEEPILNSQIKSIYIPENKKLTLWDTTYFQGKTALFEESVPCLDDIDFSNETQLLQSGITVKDAQNKQQFLQVNQNKFNKHRTYKTKVERK